MNGAQTIGAISTAYAKNPGAVERGRIPIKIISLEGCPPDFAIEITRAANTQNRIELRDFAALDDTQRRLAADLQLDRVTYVYKSGEIVTVPESSFDFVEAMIALACSHRDSSMAVQAKREISRLWDDITKGPYRSLFNPALSGRKLWRLVQLQRAIDEGLKYVANGLQGRDAMVPVHGNRLIAHLVFSRINVDQLATAEVDISQYLDQAKTLTPLATHAVVGAVNKLYPESYLASLFKNRTKCEEVVKEASGMITTP